MRTCSPLHYELFFEPDLASLTFKAKETIRVRVHTPTRKISMHAAELTIFSATVHHHGRTLDARVTLNEKKEELVLSLPDAVSGDIEVSIEFSGIHNDRLIGFYRSRYTDQTGKEKTMLSTQFEAADARRAFPCWDEPDAKATFDVSLLVDSHLTALSNMPVVSSKRMGKKTLSSFARTPMMSTYLLYLGVGEFDVLTGKEGNVQVRIVTTKGRKKHAHLALQSTKQFLAYYQTYFGIAYPLPKLDMIAVPDFASGAMENWGAITFRETALLFDPATSSLATKQRVVEVIAHELAHQWFGNLVTMKWWNNLWLNESFATFMSTKAVASLYPEWDYWDQFLGMEVSQALALDSLKSSHPIEVEVKNPSEIREIFDEISYQKGGSVLRMLEHFLGDETFRAGLKAYLTAHQYANATTEDLWDALGNASGQPVRELMGTWVKKTGYPIIDAQLRAGTLSLSQKRFCLEGRVPSETWMIPIVLESSGGKTKVIMNKTNIKLPVEGNWVKVNAGQNGLYRVAYEKDVLSALGGRVAAKDLGNFDRWGLQNDLFAQCVAGNARVKDFLTFATSYAQENDFIVLDNLCQNLYALYLISFTEHFSKEIQEKGRELVTRLYQMFGWTPRPKEKPNYTLLRSFVLVAMARFGDDSVLNEARKRFAQFVKKPSSLDPNLRAAAYSIVAWGGDEKTYEQLVSLYKKAETQEEKNRFLAALTGFQRKDLLRQALDFSLSADVRSQDMPLVILRLTSNPYGQDLIWPWLQRNWSEMCTKFGYGSPLLNRMIGSLTVISDKGKIREIESFFRKHPMPGTERKIAQTIEAIRINATFRERMREDYRN